MKKQKNKYKIGERVSAPALAGNKADKGALTCSRINKRRTGTIIYIHPSGRFITVNHRGASGEYRESYRPDQISPKKKKRA